MDYKEYGGALFLGVKKPVVKAHGSSDEYLFYFTIKQAEQFDVGLIAIKTLCSGKIENIPLAYGFLRQYENLVSVWGIRNIDDLQKLIYFEFNPPKINEQFKIELQELKNSLKN